MKYKLLLPIKVSFVIDNNELQIQDLDDLIYLQEKYDVDLQNIIDEYEYKLEAEQNFLEEEEDSFGINKVDILQGVIDENLKDISDKFNKELTLSSLDSKSVHKIFNATQEDFNNKSLLKGYNGQYTVNSINLESYDKTNSSFIIDVDIDRELQDTELNDLKSIIDSKCIDEWGSDFEEVDLSDVIQEESMYVYVKCWDAENPIDFINI